MKYDNDKEVLIRKKIDAWFVLEKPVHVVLSSGIWKNGIVKEIKGEFFILEERLEGEIPIFYQEIAKVSAFKEPEAYYGYTRN